MTYELRVQGWKGLLITRNLHQDLPALALLIPANFFRLWN